MEDRVLFAVMSRGQTPIQWSFMLRDLKLPKSASAGYLKNYVIDHQRNEAVFAMMKGGFDSLFFLDDDVFAPPDTYYRLAERDVDIVGGLYYRRGDPIEPVMRMEDKQPKTFNVGEVGEVDYVGAGCLLVKRRVFEKLGYPWFKWLDATSSLPPDERCEDYFFCRKAKEAGFKIHIDTSVKCLHAGFGRASLDGFRPLGKVEQGQNFGIGPLPIEAKVG